MAASSTVTGVPIEIGDVEADDEIEFVEQDAIVDHGRNIDDPKCLANWSTEFLEWWLGRRS